MTKNNPGKKIKLTKDFSYPDPNDPDLLTKIFMKREMMNFTRWFCHLISFQ